MEQKIWIVETESIIGHSDVFMKEKEIKFSDGKYICLLHYHLKLRQFNYRNHFFVETKEEIENVEMRCIYVPYVYICCPINDHLT